MQSDVAVRVPGRLLSLFSIDSPAPFGGGLPNVRAPPASPPGSESPTFV